MLSDVDRSTSSVQSVISRSTHTLGNSPACYALSLRQAEISKVHTGNKVRWAGVINATKDHNTQEERRSLRAGSASSSPHYMELALHRC